MSAAVGIRFTQSLQLITEECCNCHVIFAMTAEMKEQLLDKKTNFYCPNGHSQHYVGETEKQRADRLADELIAARNAQLFAERRLADEQQRSKREAERVKRRAHAGVCQECHRTFNNVARHMKTKHAVEAT